MGPCHSALLKQATRTPIIISNFCIRIELLAAYISATNEREGVKKAGKVINWEINCFFDAS